MATTAFDATLPADAWDCHCHVFGPADRFPYAQGSSYTPAEAPYDRLAGLHDRLGFRHAVIVQGACHGFDQSALLDALRRGEERHRGVALLREEVSDAELQRLHAAGVRAVRFNFVKHLGGAPSERTVRALSDRVAPLGWHLGLHLAAADLEQLQPLLARLELPFVVDHMARIDVSRGLQDAEFQRLLALGGNPRAWIKGPKAQGPRPGGNPRAWIKVSAFDRACGGRAPFGAAVSFAAALLRAYPRGALWGTDWPHPNIAAAPPDETALLRLLRQACGDDQTWEQVLVHKPRRLCEYQP